MKTLLFLLFASSTAAQVCGPPKYLCSSTIPNNNESGPGTISAPISSRTATGIVNTQNTATGGCTPSAGESCVSLQSGDNFNTSWPLGSLVINGTTYNVQAWNSATVATLKAQTGTQTNVSYTNYSSCIGQCQNTVLYDTILNSFGIDPITRITDGSTVNDSGFGGSVGNMTCSGGDNDKIWSKSGTYLAVAEGSSVSIYHLTTVNGTIQVVNAGGPPEIVASCVFSFSWTIDTRFYYIKSNSQIWQGDITGDDSFTSKELVDVMAPDVCPGVPSFMPKSNSILGLSDNDDSFSLVVAPLNQGSGDWFFVWSKTKGCTTSNWNSNSGAVYDWCQSDCSTAPPIGTFASGASNCWGSDGAVGNGIHDGQISGDGLFVTVGQAGTWTQGGCAGQTESGYAVWQVATTGNQWCSKVKQPLAYSCGVHQSVGIKQMMTPWVDGVNIRDLANVSTWTTVQNPITQRDAHGSWPHNCGGTLSDTCPWILAADSVLNSEGTVGQNGCTSAVYCPNWLNNMVYAVFPSDNPLTQTPRLFAHTYECGASTGSEEAQCSDRIVDGFGAGNAIGAASPDGTQFCWASSMLHNIGQDHTGAPRADVFCVLLQ